MSCALYRHFDASDKLLYIGISLSVLERLSQHRGSDWSKEITRVQIEYFPTRTQAGWAETAAIKKERPLHNKAGLHKPRTRQKRQPKRDCAFCGKSFAPTFKEPSFCSELCLHRYRDKVKVRNIDRVPGLLSNLG